MQDEDDGESVIAVPEYLANRSAKNVPGVYAIYNQHHDAQFIAFSDDMFSRIMVRLNA
jgi:hypothetical protein